MNLALIEAQKALQGGDVPVGAVIVYEDRLIASAHNLREACQDPLGHAELLAIAQASKILGRWRLTGCTLYVTLEPCPMCASAIAQARLDRLVYGAFDPKMGAAGTVFDLVRRFYPVEVIGGVMEARCSGLLRDFFLERRADGHWTNNEGA